MEKHLDYDDQIEDNDDLEVDDVTAEVEQGGTNQTYEHPHRLEPEDDKKVPTGWSTQHYKKEPEKVVIPPVRITETVTHHIPSQKISPQDLLRSVFEEEEQMMSNGRSDADVEKMTERLSEISNYLRKEVMGQFYDVKGRMNKKMQELILRLQQEKESLIAENEQKLDKMRESISKRDYYLIKFKNLTFRMADQIHQVREQDANRLLLRHALDSWRVYYVHMRKKKQALKIATHHWESREKRRILYGWYLWVIHAKQSSSEQLWSSRLESETNSLKNDYELRLEEMRMEQEIINNKLAHEQKEKQVLQENLRKALMRGVCAMNNKFLEIIKDTQDSNNAVNAVMGLSEHDLEEAIEQSLSSGSEDQEPVIEQNPNVLAFVQQQQQQYAQLGPPKVLPGQSLGGFAEPRSTVNAREETHKLFRMMNTNMDAGEIRGPNVRIQREPRTTPTVQKNYQPAPNAAVQRQSTRRPLSGNTLLAKKPIVGKV